MDNIFNPIYRNDYVEGYSKGLNPYMQLHHCSQNSPAFTHGFTSGRSYYESLNGNVADGIPALLVTDKVLEEFLLAGMLALNIDWMAIPPTKLTSLKMVQKVLENTIPTKAFTFSHFRAKWN